MYIFIYFYIWFVALQPNYKLKEFGINSQTRFCHNAASFDLYTTYSSSLCISYYSKLLCATKLL